MNAEPYNGADTSLKGDVEAVLRDPRLAVVNAPAPPNSTKDFDKSWGGRQKTWAYPAGTGDVDAFQFRKEADGKFKLGADGLPVLSDYFVGEAIAAVLNVQSNPTSDGFVAKNMPVPMRQPKGAEHYVLVKMNEGPFAGLERWMIRDGDPVVIADSPEGGSFTKDDRADLKAIKRIVSQIAANLS